MKDPYSRLAKNIVKGLVAGGVDLCLALNFVAANRDNINALKPFVYRKKSIRIDPSAIME